MEPPTERSGETNEPKGRRTFKRVLARRLTRNPQGKSSVVMGPTRYVLTEATCVALAIVLATRAAVYMHGLASTPIAIIIGLVVSACVIACAIKWPLWWSSFTAYVIGVAYIALLCGLALGWYVRTFALEADLTRAVLQMILLGVLAYLGGNLATLLYSRQAFYMSMGTLMLLMLLVTAILPYYDSSGGFVHTAVAIVVACHLAYHVAAVAGKPHDLEHILVTAIVFVIDLSLMTALLLGA